ncbi:MAG: DinB family protein [Alphaproteobacteria bacterium]|nr:DinB family protein [Alphaproteobacteria bacterium]
MTAPTPSAAAADPLRAHFQRMARYNRLANAILYAACAELGDAARRADRRGFFGSIHATLNHILVGDGIWFARFEGREPPTRKLDAILFDDFDALRQARAAEDGRIEAFIAALPAERLHGDFAYASMAGKPYVDAMAALLAHIFNHQTHHRGQVHDMISQALAGTGREPPSLDLHRILNP